MKGIISESLDEITHGLPISLLLRNKSEDHHLCIILMETREELGLQINPELD